MNKSTAEISGMRRKLFFLVLILSAAQLAIGYFALGRPNAKLIGTIFILSGLISAIGGTLYLVFLMPFLTKKESAALKSEQLSLSDLVEWKFDQSGCEWPILDRIVGRDWSTFLSQSSLNLKSTLVNVLSERPFKIKNQHYILAYVRCENLNFDKHVPVFEGWVLHAPDICETSEASANHNRVPGGWGLLAGGIAITVFTVALLRGHWKQLTQSDILMAGLGLLGVFGVLLYSYRQTFTRDRARGTEGALPARYLPLISSLKKSSAIRFFRIVTGQEGLLVALEPVDNRWLGEHDNIVAIASPQGDSLDALLEGITALNISN